MRSGILGRTRIKTKKDYLFVITPPGFTPHAQSRHSRPGPPYVRCSAKIASPRSLRLRFSRCRSAFSTSALKACTREISEHVRYGCASLCSSTPTGGVAPSTSPVEPERLVAGGRIWGTRIGNQQPPRQDEAEPGRSRESQAAALLQREGSMRPARMRGRAGRPSGGVAWLSAARRGGGVGTLLLLPRVGTLGNTVVGGGGQLSRA